MKLNEHVAVVYTPKLCRFFLAFSFLVIKKKCRWIRVGDTALWFHVIKPFIITLNVKNISYATHVTVRPTLWVHHFCFYNLNRGKMLKNRIETIVNALWLRHVGYFIDIFFLYKNTACCLFLKNVVGISDQECNSNTTIHITFTHYMLKYLEFSFSIYTNCDLTLTLIWTVHSFTLSFDLWNANFRIINKWHSFWKEMCTSCTIQPFKQTRMRWQNNSRTKKLSLQRIV